MNPDAIYDLLPAYHRRRDAETGEPLRALLQIITEQAALIEADIGATWDNWFIETCEPWLIPYIGELVGYAPAGGDAPPPGAVSQRREVGRTIAWRRRKGTLRLLEEIAEAVAGWPARAVEFPERVEQTLSLRLPHLDRGRSLDLRRGALLARRGGWKDHIACAPDLRRAASTHDAGRPGPHEVGLEIWRMRSIPVTDQAAACREETGPHCFTFSALAADMPLFLRVDAPGQTPLRLTRHRLAQPRRHGRRFALADPAYSTPDRSGRVAGFAIHAPGWGDGKHADGLIPADRIIPADLSDWRYQPPRHHIAVDPELGRIAFPARQIPRRPVTVTWHTGFSAAMGGGEYPRELRHEATAEVTVVRGLAALQAALARWKGVAVADGSLAADPAQPAHAMIEIADSGIYTLPMSVYLGAGNVLQIRGAAGHRPVFRLLDWQVSQADNFFVHGEAGSRLTLDGVLVFGRGIQLEGELAAFTLRHATLVPGWALGPHCDPRRAAEPSIEAIDCGACITIEHSITGSIQINVNEVTTDPVTIRIRDSIVDATNIDCDHPQCEAIGAAGSRLAFARLDIVRSTVIGRIMAHQLDRGDDSIFMGTMTIARRQRGCMRFSYVSPRSRTPRRFRCQPDLAEAQLRETAAAERRHVLKDAIVEAMLEEVAKESASKAAPPPADTATPAPAPAPAHAAPPAYSQSIPGYLADGVTAADIDALRSAVRPVFDSLRYGTPAYGRLHRRCDPAIVRGAEDRSEMGAFHDLQNPWRLAALTRRLAEFVPADCDAGILFAD